MKDLKGVYRATSKDVAEEELLRLEEKWGKKYPVVIESGTTTGSSSLNILKVHTAH